MAQWVLRTVLSHPRSGRDHFDEVRLILWKSSMPWELHIASTIGLLLGLSLLAGLLAELIRLPKVTAYLTVGLCLGPSWLDIIPNHHVETFHPILQLAIALVLFNLGCHFSFGRLRRIAGRAAILSLGELSATFVLVCGGLLLFGQPVAVAVLLGCLALATAPATTILVLKEYRSEGPITEYSRLLLAINNFAAIVAFEFAFLAVTVIGNELDSSVYAQIRHLLQDILGSILYGIITGLVLSFLCGLLQQSRWLVLLVAATTFLLGFCQSNHIPFMLTFLVAGVTVANTSNLAEKIVEQLDSLTGLLCVIFFAVHGAELDVHQFIEIGLIGVVYIVCRTAGKVLGVFGTAKVLRQPKEVQKYVGMSLLSQAGAAIALALIIEHRDFELGRDIKTIILGTVVFFELIGPVLIRHGLLRGGEVPIAHAVFHSSRTPLSQLRELADGILVAIGRRGVHKRPPRDITVNDLVHRGVTGISQSARFDKVVEEIERRRENTFPVVDDNDMLVGLIRYNLLSHVMFDRNVSRLVRAEDLATPVGQMLYLDQTAEQAFEAFQETQDDCVPVVESEQAPKLLGIVTRSDVMHMLIQRHRASE